MLPYENRARRIADKVSAKFRAEHPGRQIKEPRSIDDLTTASSG
jgi:hypothetical protein